MHGFNNGDELTVAAVGVILLPVSQYAVCAVKLSSSQSAELNSCCNSVYRRVLNFSKYDSVRACICGLGRLDFQHLRSFLTVVFIKKGFIQAIM